MQDFDYTINIDNSVLTKHEETLVYLVHIAIWKKKIQSQSQSQAIDVI